MAKYNNLDKLFGGMSEQGLLSELRNIFDSLNNGRIVIDPFILLPYV